MTTVFAFLFVIAVLIVVHELGHYAVARWCGVKVLRFSVGFGKVLWSRRSGPDQTEWVLSAVPLGGYVKMLDERETQQPISTEDLPRAFNRQPVGKRAAIVVAGPLANFLLAIAVYWVINLTGITAPAARLSAPPVNTLAAQAGITGGESIQSVNQHAVRSWNDVNWLITLAAAEGQPVALKLHGPEGGDRIVTLMTHTTTVDESRLNAAQQLGLELAQAPPYLGAIVSGGAAQQAGLHTGDIVLSINGEKIYSARELLDRIRNNPDKPLKFELERDRIVVNAIVTPRRETNARGETIGRIGAEVAAQFELLQVRYGLLDGLAQAIGYTWQTSVFNLRMLGKLVTGQLSLKNLSGPITIADYAGQTARLGWIQFFSFLAVISISLGVLNLLPIPVLDGGHLLYYLAEISLGRPLSGQAQEIGQWIGIAILLMLMSVALFNDVIRLIH